MIRIIAIGAISFAIVGLFVLSILMKPSAIAGAKTTAQDAASLSPHEMMARSSQNLPHSSFSGH